MKKILALCLMLSCFASFADVDSDLLSQLSSLNSSLTYIRDVIQNSSYYDGANYSQSITNKYAFSLTRLFNYFTSVEDTFVWINARGVQTVRPTLASYFRDILSGLDNLRIQGDVTTNELVQIDTEMQSNLYMMAEIKADIAKLSAIVPAVDTMSSEIQAINRNLSNWYNQFLGAYSYLQDIYNLLYMDLSLIQQQLYSIYDKIGDVTFDMTNALNVMWKGGIGINGTVQVSLIGSDGQPFELPEYIYNWYTSDTYIQGNEYTGYYQPLMSLSGNFYGRQFERWNKNYSQNPLNFFLSRWTDNTSNVSYQGVDGWYNALIRLVDNNGQILEANNSLLAFIAAKLSETNTVSTNEVSAAVVNAASSGSGFQTSFSLETPDLDNPLPNWSGASLPENVYFGTLYLGERQIVFSVPTSEFAVFFTLIRTGFQLTYWGLVLAFFWFAFRVLRWVCPYLAAVVHWLLQFN